MRLWTLHCGKNTHRHPWVRVASSQENWRSSGKIPSATGMLSPHQLQNLKFLYSLSSYGLSIGTGNACLCMWENKEFPKSAEVVSLSRGFPGGPDDKESAGNAGDPGSISGEGNGYPLQCSCLQNSMDRGAWWATVHGVAESQIWLSN